MTFRTLFNFIADAPRNNVGMHFAAGESYGTATDALHIYGSKRQVNICEKDIYGDYTSYCNIVFSVGANPRVSVYTVKQGICDYDHPIQFDIEDEIPMWIVQSLRKFIQ